MTARNFHMKLYVKQTLLQWSDEKWDGVFEDEDGRQLSSLEAREDLLNELAKGHQCIPVGGPCDGFDYSGGGCPGHEVLDLEKAVV